MLTFPLFPQKRVPNAARSLADLSRLGAVRNAPGFSSGQVVIVKLPGNLDTIWVEANQFQRLKYSPLLRSLAGPNPSTVADLGRAIGRGCTWVRLRQPLTPGGVQLESEDAEEESVQG